MFKKNKIKKYLDDVQANGTLSAFDYLLCDYISGRLKDNLKKMNFVGIEIHIDWLDDYKSVAIQAQNNNGMYIDFQAEKDELMIAASEDEPDNGIHIKAPEIAADASFYYDELRKVSE
ncbi:MAG: hypothetical protein IJ035_01995 [Oscillospiraceae bacterium]|nr:hypothetical protein [Oscillospiraceae bacterium]